MADPWLKLKLFLFWNTCFYKHYVLGLFSGLWSCTYIVEVSGYLWSMMEDYQITLPWIYGNSNIYLSKCIILIKAFPIFLCLLEAINYILDINLFSTVTFFSFSYRFFSPCLRETSSCSFVSTFPCFLLLISGYLISSSEASQQRNQPREGRSLNLWSSLT